MSFDLILPFFRPIEHLLLSDTVSEIMVNPDSSVWMEENGKKVHLHRIHFEQGALDAGLEVIANRFGKKLDAESPMMNLRLPDGRRLAAIIAPVVNPRPLLTIRKFTSRKLKMDDLISQKFITSQLATRIQEAVRRGDNILVSGGTGTGKTTLVNILANSIPDEDRILIIEDTAELVIRKPHVVSADATSAKSWSARHRGLTPPAACGFAIETWANECDFFSGGSNPVILDTGEALTKTLSRTCVVLSSG